MPDTTRPRRRPPSPGKVYGAPGRELNSHISLLTSVALLGLWFLVTEAGWVKPLFHCPRRWRCTASSCPP